MRHIITILFLAVFTASFAQLQKCGLPQYSPKTSAENHSFLDTCGKANYRFKRTNPPVTSPKWYFQGTVVYAGMPPDTVYLVGSALITVSYQDVNCRVYNTLTTSFWAWTGSAWRDEREINLEFLLAQNNRWTGKNTFADSLIAERGINSKGLITTKGLSSDSLITSNGMDTKGSATKSALKTDGVQANKVEVVVANKNLDGTSNVLLVRPVAADIELTLPAASANIKGWTYSIKKDNAVAHFAIIKDNGGTIIKSIYSQDVQLKAECDGVNWFVY